MLGGDSARSNSSSAGARQCCGRGARHRCPGMADSPEPHLWTKIDPVRFVCIGGALVAVSDFLMYPAIVLKTNIQADRSKARGRAAVCPPPPPPPAPSPRSC